MSRPARRLRGLLVASLALSPLVANAFELPAPVASSAGPAAAVTATDIAVLGQVVVSPIGLALDLVPRPARRGQAVEAVATVRNDSLAPIDRVVVALTATSELVRLKPSGTQTVRHLAVGAAATVTWQVCGRSPGTYGISLAATVGAQTVNGPTLTLVVVPQATC